MPYVKTELRANMDGPLNELVEQTRTLPDAERDGALNYAISYLVAKSMRPSTGWRYHFIARAYAVFLAAAAEFYRRASWYEDQAIAKNGDIEPYVEWGGGGGGDGHRGDHGARPKRKRQLR